MFTVLFDHKCFKLIQWITLSNDINENQYYCYKATYERGKPLTMTIKTSYSTLQQINTNKKL